MKILVEEVALLKKTTVSEAQKIIEKALKNQMKKKIKKTAMSTPFGEYIIELERIDKDLKDSKEFGLKNKRKLME